MYLGEAALRIKTLSLRPIYSISLQLLYRPNQIWFSSSQPQCLVLIINRTRNSIWWGFREYSRNGTSEGLSMVMHVKKRHIIFHHCATPGKIWWNGSHVFSGRGLHTQSKCEKAAPTLAQQSYSWDSGEACVQLGKYAEWHGPSQKKRSGATTALMYICEGGD